MSMVLYYIDFSVALNNALKSRLGVAEIVTLYFRIQYMCTNDTEKHTWRTDGTYRGTVSGTPCIVYSAYGLGATV